MNCEVLIGDCREVLADLEDGSIDAVVTDPPYGISFMNKSWDGPGGMLGQVATGKEKRGAFAYGGSHSRGYADNDSGVFQAWFTEIAAELLRVLKPGGHLLAFGGTRTYHRLAVAIEDAGFEIRDSIHWVYGSGFPKSLDVSKAIDKAAGAKREVIGQKLHTRKGVAVAENRSAIGAGAFGEARLGDITTSATEAAKEWEGWGTALKPAHEPIVVARKPLTGTVAANVQEHGTGALNIDATRIRTEGRPKIVSGSRESDSTYGDGLNGSEAAGSTTEGRWPPNFTLTHLPDCADDCAEGCPVAEMDGQSGEQKSPATYTRSTAARGSTIDWNPKDGGTEQVGYGDTGGASRFFPVFRYQAKAGKAERNAGLDGFTLKKQDGVRKEGNPGGDNPRNRGVHKRANHHPTVKPIDLMRWLVRLVTPSGGTVLDPFLGSGTTGIAAHLEGCDFVGIEREAEYAEIAKARIAHFQDFDSGTDTDAAAKGKDALTHDGQLSIGDAA